MNGFVTIEYETIICTISIPLYYVKLLCLYPNQFSTYEWYPNDSDPLMRHNFRQRTIQSRRLHFKLVFRQIELRHIICTFYSDKGKPQVCCTSRNHLLQVWYSCTPNIQSRKSYLVQWTISAVKVEPSLFTIFYNERICVPYEAGCRVRLSGCQILFSLDLLLVAIPLASFKTWRRTTDPKRVSCPCR